MKEAIKSILNRRMLIHIPGGLLNGVFFIFMPWFGMGFLIAFLTYEIWQCLMIADMAYKDIIGHLVGLAIVGIIWCVALTMDWLV